MTRLPANYSQSRQPAPASSRGNGVHISESGEARARAQPLWRAFCAFPHCAMLSAMIFIEFMAAWLSEA